MEEEKSGLQRIEPITKDIPTKGTGIYNNGKSIEVDNSIRVFLPLIYPFLH